MQMAGYAYISDRFFGLLLLMIAIVFLNSPSSFQAIAIKFDVGGKDGWVVKPSEDYNHWAQRNRFCVNDILYFKYKKGNDSVLLVKKEDYYSCNVNNSMHKMDDGDSTFYLNRLGCFLFISGNVDNCKKGQKLIVLVIAVKNPRHQVEAPYESPESALPPQQIDSSGLVSSAPFASKVSGSGRLQGSIGVGFEDETLVCLGPCNTISNCYQQCMKKKYKGASCLPRRGFNYTCCCNKD